MPTKELVTKVWIEEGCIVCDACETTAPTVFHVTDNTCIVRPEALNAEFTKPITADIIQAAEECPVDVIKFTLQPFEVSEEEMAAAAASAASATEAVAAPAKSHAPAAAAPVAAAPVAAAAAVPAPVAAKAPVAAMAADADPTMQLLLKAAKARGGRAGMDKAEGGGGGNGSAVTQQWADKPASELPPDAQHAKAMEATKAKAGEKDGTSRREAMKAGSMAVGVGWATFGAAAGITFGPGLARFLFPNITEEPDPKVRVGELSKFMDMAPGEVNEDNKPNGIWMIRLDDRIAALNIICTHLGCIPNWLPNDRKFKCPCHGSGYFQDGVNFEGPTPRPLERFRISVEDGIVVVDKSRKYQSELGQWDNPDSFLPV